MRFESRELKPYGEFVKSENLVEGKTYFRVSFLDQECHVPDLVPLVFIGRNLQPDEPGLYFQDAASFINGERYEKNGWLKLNENENPTINCHKFYRWFETYHDKDITEVCEYEKALNELLECSLRRRKLS